MVLVEVGCFGVDCIDDHSSCSELSRTRYGPQECIAEEVGPKAGAVLVGVEREPGEQQDWNGIGLTSAKSGWGQAPFDTSHRKCVVPDNDLAATQHPGCCGPGSGGDLAVRLSQLSRAVTPLLNCSVLWQAGSSSAVALRGILITDSGFGSHG